MRGAWSSPKSSWSSDLQASQAGEGGLSHRREQRGRVGGLSESTTGLESLDSLRRETGV